MHGRHSKIRRIAVAVALLAPMAHAASPVFTVLLQGGYSPLTQDANGLLYAVPQFTTEIDAIIPPPTTGGAWTANMIYTFSGTSSIGVISSLVAGPVGAGGLPVLYGATSGGGSANLGTVFSLKPPATAGGAWTETVLHSFSGGNDPGNPGRLTRAANGVLYGVTESSTLTGPSTVFSLTPPQSIGGSWTEAVLYTVNYSGEQGPVLGGILVAGGSAHPVLFGTTSNGGTYGCGTVYNLKPPASGAGSWTQTVLYEFTCLSDGAAPWTLIMGKNGVLYGGTGAGGINSIGVVFSLTPPAQSGGSWTEAVLYSPFSEGEPNSLVLAANGTIYGSASGGGYADGAIFSLTPPASAGGSWTARNLHTFGKTSGGDHPSILPVLIGGTLYGSTIIYSTLFSLVP